MAIFTGGTTVDGFDQQDHAITAAMVGLESPLRQPGDWFLSSIDSVLPYGGVSAKGSRPAGNSHAAGADTALIDDFYNRIHVDPARIDLGNILNAQTVPLRVFNAYFTSQSLTSVTGQNASGLIMNDPTGVSYPYAMAPLQEMTYQLEVNTSGATTLDATYVWDFAPVEDITVPITGSRVVVFPYKINWRQGFKEAYTWATTVNRAYDGTEQRFSLDASPRKAVSFDIGSYTGPDAALLRATLMGWQDRFFAVPIWSDRSALSVQASAGASSFLIDTTGRNYYDGGLVMLHDDTRNFETAEILTVNTDSLELVRPLNNTWPKGTVVTPVGMGHMPATVSLRGVTDETVTGNVSFSLDVAKTDPGVTGGAAPATFKGLEMLERRPNWGKRVEIAASSDFLTVDSGRGLNHYLSRSPAQHTYKYEFTIAGKADIQAFKQFLGRRYGKRVPFYMPTWISDVNMAGQLGDSSTGLIATNNGFTAYMADNPAVDGLYIVAGDGTVYPRDITGASLDVPSDTITFSIDTATGVTYEPEDIRQICYLAKCRLASDTVQLNYLSDAVVRVEMTVTWVAA